jgi:predicted TIM-barrel fold metal-dependent hydrolase
MYEKDGEKYFIVDEHQHFWNARPDNWVEGRENLAKGWIDCFYGYHQLAPPETHWPYEKYQRWTLEDYGRDVFEEGHVDYAVLQSTFLYYWYKEGFNTTERNLTVAEAFPGKVIVNGRWDPREGDEGLRRFEEAHKRDNYKGVKLYTAEWFENSRGYKVSDPEAYRFLEKTQELGIKNVHLHKGPTIWPLDRDAFDVEDVDKAATDFPELNFIVEHAGVPRIEQFAYIAVQEPNVYAGLSVVIGAHMYARPNTFARFMGELLFWVGEDRIVFGSDYGIWEPKWQVEGFIDWQMPDSEQFSDYPKLTTAAKKKIMGLNAAKLYDIDVPPECQIPAPGTTADEHKAPGEELFIDAGTAAGAQA